MACQKIQNTGKILEIHGIKNVGNINFNIMSNENSIANLIYV